MRTGRSIPKFKCKACPIHKQTEWCVLTSEELDQVSNLKRDRLFEPGEVIFNQGDPCEGMYWIRDGLVGERRLDPDGDMALVRLCQTGKTLGYQELLSEKPYRNSAEALRETRVCFLTRSLIRSLLASNAKLGDHFLQRSLNDMQRIEDSYVHALNRGIRSRLLDALLELYEMFGYFEAEVGHVLELPIARKDLAALVGTGPETLSRTIRKLEAEQIARFEGRKVVFSNLAAATAAPVSPG